MSYTGPRDDKGKPHGKGKYVWNDGSSYEGELTHGELHGEGTFRWPNGNAYCGNFEKGQRHGKGIFIWSEGDAFEGDFVQNKISGYGTYWYSNGDKYLGQWSAGRQEGKGCMYIAATRSFFDGSWKNGEIVHGVWVGAEGHVYEGPFRNRQPHGDGIYTFPTGRTKKGKFDQGDMDQAKATIIPNHTVKWSPPQDFLASTPKNTTIVPASLKNFPKITPPTLPSGAISGVSSSSGNSYNNNNSNNNSNYNNNNDTPQPAKSSPASKPSPTPSKAPTPPPPAPTPTPAPPPPDPTPAPAPPPPPPPASTPTPAPPPPAPIGSSLPVEETIEEEPFSNNTISNDLDELDSLLADVPPKKVLTDTFEESSNDDRRGNKDVMAEIDSVLDFLDEKPAEPEEIPPPPPSNQEPGTVDDLLDFLDGTNNNIDPPSGHYNHAPDITVVPPLQAEIVEEREEERSTIDDLLDDLLS